MAQVVLSLEEKYDKKLRSLAVSLHGGKKGAMSEIVEQGIDLVEEKEKREKAYEKLLAHAKNAKSLGIGKFSREECYAK